MRLMGFALTFDQDMVIIPDLKIIEKVSVASSSGKFLQVFDIQVITGETSYEKNLQYDLQILDMTNR